MNIVGLLVWRVARAKCKREGLGSAIQDSGIAGLPVVTKYTGLLRQRDGFSILCTTNVTVLDYPKDADGGEDSTQLSDSALV